MEVIMSQFFDGVFLDIDRGSLFSRMRRRQFCDYLSEMIEKCSVTEDGTESNCDKAVRGAIEYHVKTKRDNSGICLMGKYHSVLYVAVRLAFTFDLRNTDTVKELLSELYSCEGSFERLISGAIFGPQICNVFSGWKSDFDTRDECREALRYFLHHSSLARMYFLHEGVHLRMADVPLLVCMRASPATVATKVQRPDVLSLLVEYGAKIDNMPFGLLSPIELLGEDESLADSAKGLECLVVVSRVHPKLRNSPPASLKQLAKVAIRERLNQNFQLPDGIDKLPLPGVLIGYVGLKQD